MFFRRALFLLCFGGLVSSCGEEVRNDAFLDGYAQKNKLWLSKTIPVCWENGGFGHWRYKALVKRTISRTWQHYSSLRFVGWGTCTRASKGVRIRIQDSKIFARGIGRVLDGVRNGVVLNFTFRNWSRGCQKNKEQCIKMNAVHEFGHVIGLAHEHNRKDRKGNCKKTSQGTDGDTYLTTYDAYSIMNYCGDPYRLKGGAPLSRGDIVSVRKLYGRSDRSSKLPTRCYYV